MAERDTNANQIVLKKQKCGGIFYFIAPNTDIYAMRIYPC
jgi:hypothetical protein